MPGLAPGIVCPKEPEMHPVKFRTQQDFDAAVAQVDAALATLPSVRRSRPETLTTDWQSWRSSRYEAETADGTIRYQADIESSHIRVRVITPDGKSLPDPFSPAVPAGPLCMSHLGGKALMERDAIAKFLAANAVALRSVMLGGDLPTPQPSPALNRQLRAALDTVPPPATTALFPDGGTTTFAALRLLRMFTADEGCKATRDEAVVSLASRTALLVDELCHCAGCYSREDFRSALEHAHKACRMMQDEFGPAARDLASDASVEVKTRMAAIEALHVADEIERTLDLEIFGFSLGDERAHGVSPSP
jgi:hypothetical protein